MTPPCPAGVDARQLEPLCRLDEPTRRRLYDYVAAQVEPVSRDRISEALGVDRSTVAYHLDQLVEQGLLTASFARPEGRTGPGAGRPAKHYQRAADEFAVSVPPRDYRLAAELLARAAEADTTGTVSQALKQAAADLGRDLVTSTDDPSNGLIEQLAGQGFEPYQDGQVIRLRNCPFNRLAQQHTELVCGMNLAMLTGSVETSQAPYQARLDPTDDCCCVTLVPTS